MDLADVAFLISARGKDVLEAARATRGAEPLARRKALASVAAAEARLALAQDDLRARAATKTPLADRLLFTREALEQATPHAVAVERARRFATFASVADLGAGIGLDTLALAAVVSRVVAAERDAVRAALLRHNVAAAGVAERVAVVEGDFLTADDPRFRADAAFLDPHRRPGGTRTRDPSLFEPPRDGWAAVARRYGNLLVKLPPVAEEKDASRDDMPAVASAPEAGRDGGIEFVSLEGAMKESRVGYGALAISVARRALVLPAGVAVEGTGIPWPAARAPREGDVLLDPDPAVVVAGLVGDAALAARAYPIHPRIAYLLADRAAPWARSMRVERVLPADAGAIREALESAGTSDVEILCRGIADSVEAWRRRIRPRACRPAKRSTVVLTRGPDDRYVALLVRDVADPPAGDRRSVQSQVDDEGGGP